MIYLGVDPGQKGGIAFLSTDSSYAEAEIMPGTVTQIVSSIKRFKGEIVMVVERAQPMPKQGVSSVFSYGQHFGCFEAIAACLEMRYVTVRPAEWKKAMGLNSEKTHSILEAERLFPKVELIPPRCRKPSDGIAEALLIAEYAKRKQL